ncbi:ribosome maturation factor RimP [Cellulomonas sp. KRMCY2]|uniref:ribosome maturation factor RimP n=1 Tax=Cellulomonas sp. KRMCY2 TaxID=1304865 RepID=UPI00045EA2A7|nr:ribosome maturation factor RimP [Cellulomonas sp. KRMCY2]
MVTPASTDPAQRVREVVQPVAEAAGLVLEDVHVSPAGRRSVVRIVLDLGDDAIGSLDLDTLGAASRDISAALDAADPVHGQYVLEVSTPGTDRPLTELRHFRRARTRLVQLTLRDGSTVHGRLVAAEADGYDVETAPGTVVQVDPAQVARAAVEVELKHVHDEGPHDEEDLD